MTQPRSSQTPQRVPDQHLVDAAADRFAHHAFVHLCIPRSVECPDDARARALHVAVEQRVGPISFNGRAVPLHLPVHVHRPLRSRQMVQVKGAFKFQLPADLGSAQTRVRPTCQSSSNP